MAGILLLGLLLRTLVFVASTPWQAEVREERLLVADARGYYQLAVNLLEHGVFSEATEPPLVPDLRRGPAFPGLAALVFALAGVRPSVVLLLQVLLASATCLLTYRIGRRLFDARIATFATALHAIDYASVFVASRFLTETLFVAFFHLHVLFFVEALLTGRRRSLVASGALLALAALTRPVAVYYAFALAPVLLIHHRRRIGDALRSWATLVLVFLAAISPWIARNFVVSGYPVLSFQQVSVLRWYLPSLFPADPEWKTKLEAEMGGSGPAAGGSVVAGGVADPAGAPHGAANAGRDVLALVRGSVRFFATIGTSSYLRHFGVEFDRTEDQDAGVLRNAARAFTKSPLQITVALVLGLYLAFLYVTALLGAVRLARDGRYVVLSLIVLTTLYFVAATGSLAVPRYRLPVLPYLMLLSGVGFFSWVDRRRGGNPG